MGFETSRSPPPACTAAVRRGGRERVLYERDLVPVDDSEANSAEAEDPMVYGIWYMERERDNRLRALCPPQAQTPGYIGGGGVKFGVYLVVGRRVAEEGVVLHHRDRRVDHCKKNVAFD